MDTSRFRKKIWNYYYSHPRSMPWRLTHDSYRVLISEIMLQQTQVARVVDFYKNFIKKFPNFNTLANAKTSDILAAWQGLGYNRRALALQKLAKKVVEEYRGRLPREREKLESLPGVGPYTAGAIRAFAFNEPEIFIETNIRRVFIHFFFPEEKTGDILKKSAKKVTDVELWRYIERTVDKKNPREWYYALMDYGAMLGETMREGIRDGVAHNPNRRSAHYVRQSKFVGSDREIRGKILKILIEKKQISRAALVGSISKTGENGRKRADKILLALVREGFLVKNGSNVRIIN